MTKDQIDTLVSNWLESELDDSDEWRNTYGPLSDNERECAPLFMEASVNDAREALASNNFRVVEKEADDLLKSAGLPALDHDSAEYGRLCRRLLRAKMEFAKIQKDRWNGEYHDDHFKRPVTNHHSNGYASEAPQGTTTKRNTPSHLFSVVLEKYLAANPRPARTAKPLKAEFLKFIQTIGGDRPIAAITKADGVSYKESLQHTRKLSLSTAIKHISNADALFKWAEVHAFNPEGTNPMKGLAPSKRQAKKTALKRRPFTDEELLTVLGSEEFRSQRVERPERYWLVLMLLFECCRREEAAQLYLKDIGEVDGIPFIQITDEEKDQSLKNEGSKRRVPIHSSLIQLGFMQYVASIKQAGHTRLFPQLKRKGNNGYGDPVGKWFGRHVTLLGLADPRLVIHSLRHGGITKLHSAGVPVNIAETLTGHSAGNVHEQYVHKELISMRTLQEGLEKLRYEHVLTSLMQS